MFTQELLDLWKTRDLAEVSTNDMSDHGSVLLFHFFLSSVTEVFSRKKNLRLCYFWDKTSVLSFFLGFYSLDVWVCVVASCVSPPFSLPL